METWIRAEDAAYYWSLCILKTLRDKGFLSPAEYTTIRTISADHYHTRLIVS